MRGFDREVLAGGRWAGRPGRGRGWRERACVGQPDVEDTGPTNRRPKDSLPVSDRPTGGSAAKPALDQHWPLPDGEVALTITIARPLSAADFASIGSVVAQIEKLVAGLVSGETNG